MQEFGEIDDVEHEDAGFLESVAVAGEEILDERILRRSPDMTDGAFVRKVVLFEVGEQSLRDGVPPRSGRVQISEQRPTHLRKMVVQPRI